MFNFKKSKRLRKEVKAILDKKVKVKRILQTKQPEVVDGEFTKCNQCEVTYQTSKAIEKMFTCPKCGYYFRLNPKKRIKITFDSFREILSSVKQSNPLDLAIYADKLKEAKKISNENSAVTVGIATIEDQKFATFIMNHEFIMGSMGSVVGEKIKKLFNYAIKHKLPVVGFCASGGARMQESMYSLMQMVKTSSAVGRFKKTKHIYIPVLTTPTYGGVSASFAMLGDIIIAEEKAMIGFAGKKVIKDAMKKELPDGFQTAEFLKEKGFVDIVATRFELKEILYKILKMHKKGKG